MLGLILVPLVVSGILFYLFKGITWKEFLLQIGGCIVIIVAGYFLARWGALRDTEYLNGHIIDKPYGTQACCHCSVVCDSTDEHGDCVASHVECDHSQDYWWDIKTSVGTISVDWCSGSARAPKSWKTAAIGEPASLSHKYTNYLLADKESLIRHDIENKFKGKIPAYPTIYGLYKRNTVVSDGSVIPPGWQDWFAQLNDRLGAKKQVDVVILLTSEKDPTYAQAVESKWLYGPKNALTIILGVEDNRVNWARAVTISRVEDLKIAIRDNLQGKKLEEVPPLIEGLVEAKFERTPMSTFEYLNKSVTPSRGLMILLYVLGILLSVGLGIYMHIEDPFGDERKF